MAFPVVHTADTQSGTVTSNSTSWTITWPTNIGNGDLILFFVSVDGTFPPTGGGWTQFVNVTISSGANILGLGKRKANGTETGTFTLTMASEQGAWRIFRITNWEGTLGTVFSNSANSGAVVAPSANTGTDAAPDPPSVDPSNWATEETLWLAICGVNTSRTISVFPFADLQTADVSGGAGGATLGVCMSSDVVGSNDPGAFTISAADDWLAASVAIRPAAAVTHLPYRSAYSQFLPTN
jgi:hypothetical protein